MVGDDARGRIFVFGGENIGTPKDQGRTSRVWMLEQLEQGGGMIGGGGGEGGGGEEEEDEEKKGKGKKAKAKKKRKNKKGAGGGGLNRRGGGEGSGSSGGQLRSWEIVRHRGCTPVARKCAASCVVGSNIIIHGGEVADDASCDVLEVFDMERLHWTRCPLLGEAPRVTSEHILFPFVYPHDPDKLEYVLCFGGYVAQVGSSDTLHGFGGGAGFDQKRELEDMAIQGVYRSSLFRLDPRTLLWTKFRDRVDCFLPTAQAFGGQRLSDGAIVMGGGYGPLTVSTDAEKGMMKPQQLWHSYEIAVDDCGDCGVESCWERGLFQMRGDDGDGNDDGDGEGKGDGIEDIDGRGAEGKEGGGGRTNEWACCPAFKARCGVEVRRGFLGNEQHHLTAVGKVRLNIQI